MPAKIDTGWARTTNLSVNNRMRHRDSYSFAFIKNMDIEIETLSCNLIVDISEVRSYQPNTQKV